MPYFLHDNLEFYFEEYGSGFPFIFNHGLGADLTQAREMVGPLPGFRLIFCDGRGHGRTANPGPPSDLTFARMADDVLALMDALSIERAIIGGLSMGAGVALSFCLKRPRRIRALILTRPAWLNKSTPRNLMIFLAVAELIRQHGIQQAHRLFLQSELYDEWLRKYPPAVRAVEGFFAGPSAKAITATFETLPCSAPYRHVSELKRVSVPTLVVANCGDPIHPFEYAEALANAIPGARLEEIPSKTEGVALHLSTFQRSLQAFLENLPHFPEPCS